jgi:hypothetical protein
MFKYMDQNKENNLSFIKIQKTQIDKMLDVFNYRGAFTLLVLTLSTLNESDKKDFIQYYKDDICNKKSGYEIPLNQAARY